MSGGKSGKNVRMIELIQKKDGSLKVRKTPSYLPNLLQTRQNHSSFILKERYLVICFGTFSNGTPANTIEYIDLAHKADEALELATENLHFGF